MNVGIVVEGDRDAEAYPELIRKIRDDIETILAKPCGGSSELMKKFVGWLKHFQWHAQRSIDKAIVIVDTDCSNASALEDRLRHIYDQSRFHPGFPVHFHATKCEIETWLLADERAVSQVSRQRGKNKQVAAVPIRLESHRNAKGLFHRILSEGNLPATPRVYREIASAADVERIAARCPSFQNFAKKVRAC